MSGVVLLVTGGVILLLLGAAWLSTRSRGGAVEAVPYEPPPKTYKYRLGYVCPNEHLNLKLNDAICITCGYLTRRAVLKTEVFESQYHNAEWPVEFVRWLETEAKDRAQ